MNSDNLVIESLSMGLIEARPDGSIWRIATRSRTGRVIPIRPSRADLLDKGTGYRRVRLGKYGSVVAHRIVWIAANGPLGDGVEIDHKNGVKSDNRIENLDPVTHLENVQRAFRAGRVPPRVGEANGQSKLTEPQVIEIRRRVAQGEAKRALAREYKVTSTLVRNIARGRAWKHAAFPEVTRG